MSEARAQRLALSMWGLSPSAPGPECRQECDQHPVRFVSHPPPLATAMVILSLWAQDGLGFAFNRVCLFPGKNTATQKTPAPGEDLRPLTSAPALGPLPLLPLPQKVLKAHGLPLSLLRPALAPPHPVGSLPFPWGQAVSVPTRNGPCAGRDGGSVGTWRGHPSANVNGGNELSVNNMSSFFRSLHNGPILCLFLTSGDGSLIATPRRTNIMRSGAEEHSWGWTCSTVTARVMVGCGPGSKGSLCKAIQAVLARPQALSFTCLRCPLCLSVCLPC